MDKRAVRLLSEIAELWNKTEARAKVVEQFRHEAITACINEMRYAGRRLVDVMAHLNGGRNDDQFDAVENLVIAKGYLINADHDLTDAAIFFAHLHILRVVETHGRDKVVEHCREFEELYPAIQEAHAIVSGAREDRATRRAEYARLAEEYVPRIIALHERLSQIAELRVVEDKALAQVGLWVRINTGLALAGSVASLTGVVLAIIGLWLIYHPPQ